MEEKNLSEKETNVRILKIINNDLGIGMPEDKLHIALENMGVLDNIHNFLTLRQDKTAKEIEAIMIMKMKLAFGQDVKYYDFKSKISNDILTVTNIVKNDNDDIIVKYKLNDNGIERECELSRFKEKVIIK